MELSSRSYSQAVSANHWEEIWEAGPYYDRISELLEDAHSYAVFTGWQIDSRLALRIPRRNSPDLVFETHGKETLKQKIIRLCEQKPGFQFFFLMWDHAYFYAMERETWQGRIWDSIHPRIHFIFDNHHPFGGCHHEKVCLVDGKIALCGGIDLCDERWDTPQHLYSDPRRSLDWKKEKHGPYHDLGVQVSGAVCRVIQEHIARRWRELSRIPFPDPPSSSPKPGNRGKVHTVYVSRTVAKVDSGINSTPIVREIEFLFRDLIRAARHRLVLEGQYYWSREINDLLITKMHEMRNQDFEIILVLAYLKEVNSLTRSMSRYEMKLLEQLEQAARYTGTQLILGAPYSFPCFEPSQERGVRKPVYIHSKLIIVDDRYLSVGSANLAGRAMRLDTEINLTLEARNEAEKVHIRRVADFVQKHWQIKEGVHATEVKLCPLRPGEELLRNRGEYMVAPPGFGISWLPWHRFFDPEIPFFHRLKRGLRVQTRLHRGRAVFGLLLVVTLGWATAISVIGDWRWESMAYSAVLSLNWLLPFPMVAITLFSAFHLGMPLSFKVVSISFWITSLLGYTLIRMFPTAAARYYSLPSSQASWALNRMGSRTFSELMRVLLDPRISTHSKIALQGYFCIPFPWFVVGDLLVLTSVLSLIPVLAVSLVPTEVSDGMRSHGLTLLGLWIAITAGYRVAKKSARKRSK